MVLMYLELTIIQRTRLKTNDLTTERTIHDFPQNGMKREIRESNAGIEETKKRVMNVVSTMSSWRRRRYNVGDGSSVDVDVDVDVDADDDTGVWIDTGRE